MYLIRTILIWIVILAAIIIFLFRGEIFKRELTPLQVEQYNLFILQDMDRQEKEASAQMARDKIFNDCVRAAISRSESPGQYYPACYRALGSDF